jgi:hypothetical protein
MLFYGPRYPTPFLPNYLTDSIPKRNTGVQSEASRTGTFDAVTGSDLSDGTGLALLYVNNDVDASRALLGDLNFDGFVGIADLNVVLGNWNAGTPPTVGEALAPLVPESANLLVLGVGIVAMICRRR